MAGASGLFMGDARAMKAAQFPVDFDEYIDGLRARAAGATALDSPWFNAIISKRANGVTAIPRRVMRGETEVEPTDLPFRIDLADLLYRGSMALDVYGAAYFAVVQNARRAPLEVRWLDPRTIRLRYDERSGRLLGFERVLAGMVVQTYPYDETTRRAPGIAWAWTSGMNETGPGDTLARACELPAKTLVMADELMRGLYERGAINQHFVTANFNPPEAEKERLTAKLKRVFFGGVDKAHTVEVFNEGLVISKIGTDPNALELGPTADRLQNDICAMCDTPRILLNAADASNRATIDRITQTWLLSTIQPHAVRIVDALNEHALRDAGYMLTLNTAGLDVDQQEEAEKAAAWAVYVDRGVNAETAAEMLGIDIPEGMPFVEGPSKAELMAQAQAAAMQQPEPEPAAAEDDNAARKRIELERLGRFIENGTYLARPFKSDILTPDEIEAAIIRQEWAGYP